MFNSKKQLLDGRWCINNLDCSIEFLRFINETVQFSRENRPWADQVLKHPYFSIDLTTVPTIKQNLSKLRQYKLACFETQIDGISKNFKQMSFSSKDLSNFNELDEALFNINNKKLLNQK